MPQFYSWPPHDQYNCDPQLIIGWRMTFFAGKPYDLLVKTMIGYFSIPQIDGKVNHHQIFHLFGDDYIAHLKNHGLFPVDVPKRPDETAFHSGAGGVSLEHPRTSWGSLAPKIVGCSFAPMVHWIILGYPNWIWWFGTGNHGFFPCFSCKDLPFKSGMVGETSHLKPKKVMGDIWGS